ncbi:MULTISPECIES: SOS response-associated peptidase [Halobacterium]|uniref:UPF0361 family protein n=4 Tax=Halobacterium salinarum TaxID=2242 RepID=Q9HRI0_HALSA|nr:MULTISPECIES: SOS response-associated peptidase [Halobacterium]AAG19178.1 conserved hypothetical protein [Halobacterium salinarum NRC-1]MBB6090021.1 putative SOS response-associated peptidase YedK [Halobacterium salinarum]MCF2206598.1 SOS response-associated peptidase [Halobacterium salinarum]MCF2241137.1 SOS response-associated peptidase [Halobacterium salinarum]MDL0120737.1 SOS response-associated peptidase [Halobacterium salinarum]
MCGRYALFSTPETLRETFGLTTAPVEPTYNAAPSQSLPVILDTEPTETVRARWGLVPSWSDGPQSAPDPINARAETLTETRHFQAAYEHRRCLVPVDGFYEWRDEDGATVPYFVSRTDGAPFLLAGLWETWTPEQTQTGLGEFTGDDGPSRDPETVRSFTVVTTQPNAFLADYHHRMAVVLTPAQGQRWLTDDDPTDLFTPGAFDLQAWRVSTAVNDPTVDRPALVEPA